MRKSLLLATMSLGLTGCIMVGPNYHAPDNTAIPSQWSAPQPSAEHGAALDTWWTQFNDPLLSQLIDRAEISSPTVDQALARIRQARAAVSSSRAALWPSLTAVGSASRANAGAGAAVGIGGISSEGGTASELASIGVTTSTSIGLDASWEIDLFGGNQRSVQAANARLSSSEANGANARVSLSAEVANAYAQRRQCEALQGIDEADLQSRSATYRLTALKLDAGFVAPADAQRTEAAAADSANTLAIQQGLCAQALNQLVALTGLPYADLEARLAASRAQIPRAAINSLMMLPADAIRQRPDVRAAERNLVAANANIGVAVANRLPQLSLSGAIGINRSRTDFSSARSDTWSFGPSLSLPIFDGGRGAAAVETARGAYDEALAAYQASVRSAVQEVENALVRVDTIARREGDAARANARYQTYFSAVEAQYRQGAASLLELEEGRRLMLSSQQGLIAARLEQAQAWIALYKAVGGGWPIEVKTE